MSIPIRLRTSAHMSEAPYQVNNNVDARAGGERGLNGCVVLREEGGVDGSTKGRRHQLPGYWDLQHSYSFYTLGRSYQRLERARVNAVYNE